MVKYFIITLIFIILLVGCSSCQYTQNTNQETQSVKTTEVTETKPIVLQNTQLIINEQNNGEFYLGMSKQEVLTKLDSMQIKADNKIEITKDTWELGNEVFFAREFNFTFDKDHMLYEITVYKDTPTTLGLKHGDSFDNMQILYGTNYNNYKSQNNSLVYEYFIDGHYFRVFFENNKVAYWEISKFKFDK